MKGPDAFLVMNRRAGKTHKLDQIPVISVCCEVPDSRSATVPVPEVFSGRTFPLVVC